MTTFSTQQKPNLVTAIAVMTLISGIVNIFWGLIASITMLATLVGIICTPFTALPTILGIFEIIFAAKLLSDRPQGVRPGITLAAFEIACILAGNAFSMIVGILALIFYNDLMVKAYFAEINEPQAPVKPVPALPVVPEAAPLEPAPEIPGEPQSPAETPGEGPDEPGDLSDPRRPRKVA